MLSRKLICFIWNGWDSNKKMTSYTENTRRVSGPLVLARDNPLLSDVNVLLSDVNVLLSDVNVLVRSDVNVLLSDVNVLLSDVNVLEKRYVESLDELDRIALNVARSTLGSLFSLEKSNHYMEWKRMEQIGRTACLDRSPNQNA
jgi:hypothetical protein